MDKELLELIRSLAGDAQSVVLWYFALGAFNNLVSWVGGITCCYWFGRGVRGLGLALKHEL